MEGYPANWNNIVAGGKETKLGISLVAASEKEVAQTWVIDLIRVIQ